MVGRGQNPAMACFFPKVCLFPAFTLYLRGECGFCCCGYSSRDLNAGAQCPHSLQHLPPDLGIQEEWGKHSPTSAHPLVAEHTLQGWGWGGGGWHRAALFSTAHSPASLVLPEMMWGATRSSALDTGLGIGCLGEPAVFSSHRGWALQHSKDLGCCSTLVENCCSRLFVFPSLFSIWQFDRRGNKSLNYRHCSLLYWDRIMAGGCIGFSHVHFLGAQQPCWVLQGGQGWSTSSLLPSNKGRKRWLPQWYAPSKEKIVVMGFISLILHLQ